MVRNLVAATVLLALAAPLSAERTAILVVGNHAPPYRIIQDGHFSGLYVDLFREIAHILDVPVEFLEAPQLRALAMLQDGSADVMLGPNRTPEREAFMDYTAAEFPAEPKVFYTRVGMPRIDHYEDLAHRTVAVVRGLVYFEPFDSDTTLEREAVGDYEAAFRKVANGRNDAVVVPELQGDYLLKQMGLPLVKGSYVAHGRPSYITLSKRSPFQGLRPKIEAAMKSLKADGTWDKIVARYR